jgi:hypothetical protein
LGSSPQAARSSVARRSEREGVICGSGGEGRRVAARCLPD